MFTDSFHDVSDSCADEDLCLRTLHQTIKDRLWAHAMHREGTDVDCLQECLDPLYGAMDEGFVLCSACDKEIKKRDQGAREDVWRTLPQFFGLDIPGWMSDTQ